MTSRGAEPSDLRRIAALRGEDGVLSIYVDARPERKAQSRPALEIALRTGLRDALHAPAAAGGSAARARAYVETIEHLIAELTDVSGAGRGRALFAVVGGATVGPLQTQAPLPDRVVLGEHPHVAPLLLAVDAARPAGVVVITANALRILETRDATAVDVASYEYDDSAVDRRELRGPASSSRGTYESSRQADLFVRRRERHRDQWIEGLCPRVEEMSGERGWDHVLLLGEQQAASFLRERLASAQPVLTGHGTRLDSPDAIAGQVRGELSGLRQRERTDLARRAIDAALSGGRGAVGWDDVATVVAEGRAECVLVDPAGRPAEADGAGATADQDRLIARAFETDAEVVPVAAGAARLLAAHGGIAALLRW